MSYKVGTERIDVDPGDVKMRALLAPYDWDGRAEYFIGVLAGWASDLGCHVETRTPAFLNWMVSFFWRLPRAPLVVSESLFQYSRGFLGKGLREERKVFCAVHCQNADKKRGVVNGHEYFEKLVTGLLLGRPGGMGGDPKICENWNVEALMGAMHTIIEETKERY